MTPEALALMLGTLLSIGQLQEFSTVEPVEQNNQQNSAPAHPIKKRLNKYSNKIRHTKNKKHAIKQPRPGF
ncbi:MAG: hypothetical protein WD055_04560 [Candidatus Dependentiae bacterium]